MKQASKSYLLHELVRQEEELKAKVQEAEFAKAAVLDELNKLNKVLEKQTQPPKLPQAHQAPPLQQTPPPQALPPNSRLQKLLEQAQRRKLEAERLKAFAQQYPKGVPLYRRIARQFACQDNSGFLYKSLSSRPVRRFAHSRNSVSYLS